tara:strand:+ start:2144 stop:2731 length:588 start_codon:yes stop_codon:yes gene_type:complete
MSDFSSMNTTQLMIEANRLRKKLKKRRGGFGFDNTPDALGRLFGRSSTMGNDLLGGSVMGAIARKLSKSRNRYDALMAELKKRKGSSTAPQAETIDVGPQTNVGVMVGQDPNAASTTSSNVLQPLMPNAVNRQQIQPGGTGELNEGTDLITPIDPNAQKGFISQEEQFGNVNALNPMMPPNPFDPDATGINSLYN